MKTTVMVEQWCCRSELVRDGLRNVLFANKFAPTREYRISVLSGYQAVMSSTPNNTRLDLCSDTFGVLTLCLLEGQGGLF
ncbi:MAG: hypothetical protein ABW185_26005 [Sedimenticola sp.]